MCDDPNMRMSQSAYALYCVPERLLGKDSDNCMCTPLDKIYGKSALDLLKICGVTDVVPVDLKVILNELGLSALPTDFSLLERNYQNKILGALVTNGNNAAIFYNKNTDFMSSHRVRFTIAHELGHYCLTGKKSHIEFRMDSTKDTIEEKAANIFAGELLIPEHSLKNIINKLYIPTIDSLANIFDVSRNVMEARLQYLGWERLVLE